MTKIEKNLSTEHQRLEKVTCGLRGVRFGNICIATSKTESFGFCWEKGYSDATSSFSAIGPSFG